MEAKQLTPMEFARTEPASKWAGRNAIAICAVLAVAALGWIGYEQHQQTEQAKAQTCWASIEAMQNTVASLTTDTLSKTGVATMYDSLANCPNHVGQKLLDAETAEHKNDK